MKNMTASPLGKITEAKKEHYKLLGIWLKNHPEINFKKLSPYGFRIDITTVSENLVDEFIEMTTYKN